MTRWIGRGVETRSLLYELWGFDNDSNGSGYD